MKRIIPTAATALLVAGCSGGGGSSSEPTPSPSPTIDYTSAQSIAAAMDKGGFVCTDWQQDTDILVATEAGSCDHAGQIVSVAVYPNAQVMRDVTAAFQESLGDPENAWVMGDAWMVYDLPTEVAAQSVAQILGGEVQ